MRQKLRFTGSLLLIFVVSFALAQEDSTRNYFSIDATIDYGKFATLLMDSQTKYEGEIGVMYGRYRLTGEYGQVEINSTNLFDNAEIKADGNYYRLGFDIKFPINLKNNLYAGLRYASSAFDESVLITYNSAVYNPYFEENKGLTARWYELVISSETKVIGGLFLGFKARVRFLDRFDNPGFVDLIEIPGYGKTYDETVLAINLYLRYHLTFGK